MAKITEENNSSPTKRSPNPRYLPIEIIANILSRLPLTTIVRASIVCKNWRTLITSRWFHRLQISLSVATRRRPSLLLPQPGGITLVSGENFFSLPYPFPGRTSRRFRVNGCVHGLVCVVEPNEQIFVWNPIVRSYFQIPTPFPVHESDLEWAVGLGYNSSIDDYVVVKFCFLKGNRSFTVYAMDQDKWKELVDSSGVLGSFEEGWFCCCDPVFLHGSIHWTMKDSNGEYHLLAYNVSNQAFEMIELPNVAGFSMTICSEETVVSRNLTVISELMGCVEVWKRRGYMWEKVSQMEVPDAIGMGAWILGIWNNEVLWGRKISSEDPDSVSIVHNEVEGFEELDVEWNATAVGYKESLLLLGMTAKAAGYSRELLEFLVSGMSKAYVAAIER